MLYCILNAKMASESLVNFWKELQAPGEYVFYKNGRGDWGQEAS